MWKQGRILRSNERPSWTKGNKEIYFTGKSLLLATCLLIGNPPSSITYNFFLCGPLLFILTRRTRKSFSERFMESTTLMRSIYSNFLPSPRSARSSSMWIRWTQFRNSWINSSPVSVRRFFFRAMEMSTASTMPTSGCRKDLNKRCRGYVYV